MRDDLQRVEREAEELKRHSQEAVDGRMEMACSTEMPATVAVRAHIERLRTDANDLQELLDHLPKRLSPGAQRALRRLAFS